MFSRLLMLAQRVAIRSSESDSKSSAKRTRGSRPIRLSPGYFAASPFVSGYTAACREGVSSLSAAFDSATGRPYETARMAATHSNALLLPDRFIADPRMLEYSMLDFACS